MFALPEASVAEMQADIDETTWNNGTILNQTTAAITNQTIPVDVAIDAIS